MARLCKLPCWMPPKPLKITLFQACASSLWCKFTNLSLKNITVADNNSFRFTIKT